VDPELEGKREIRVVVYKQILVEKVLSLTFGIQENPPREVK
jgi:hypothetical protein